MLESQFVVAAGLEEIGLPLAAVIAGVIFLVIVGTFFIFSRFYRQVDQGKALIVNKKSGPVVVFTGSVVLPIVHRAEIMDISVKSLDIDRRGKDGLICKDNIRADIKVAFFVRVNKTPEDVLKVAQSIGCARASDLETLDELFSAKFSEALKTVGKQLEFEELYTKRGEFKDQLIEVIGRDLNGYILDDAAIDYLEQTPLNSLDPHNILDAQGIRKITEITAKQNVFTNELRQKERMDVGSQNLTADEAVFRYEQQRADAEAKKHKEIAISMAREQNEAMRVASDENKKTSLVQQINEGEIGKAEQDKVRQIAIAEKAREREISIEVERNEKARATEAIGRERAVELLR
ncbi:MAG TPA: SPFH domain-containing protein, partial [Nannocystis sp.]